METKPMGVPSGHASRTRKPSRPNYNMLHAQLLPVKTYPLPAIIPHNPLSVLYFVFTYISQVFRPPSSFPDPLYEGRLSLDCRSIHITDTSSIRALWEHGFFGKGNLSRSEPTWLNREKQRRGLIVCETSEDVTKRRREERKAFKKERARKLQDNINEKLRAETGGRNNTTTHVGDVATHLRVDQQDTEFSKPDLDGGTSTGFYATATPNRISGTTAELNDSTMDLGKDLTPGSVDGADIVNQEHLQLDPCEAFFLVYGLGLLSVRSQITCQAISTSDLFRLFLCHATFPPTKLVEIIEPDNQFILTYVAYHHFRSLGWIVRSGIKFAVDLMLYNRGPVFSHAEFAVLVIPSFTDKYWTKDGASYADRMRRSKKWHWLHMINRVQSQVKKTLVLCYVEVPPPWSESIVGGGDVAIRQIISAYKVREVVLKRWVPNRTRD